MNLRTAIDNTAGTLARRDAETLLLHVLGRDRAWLFAHPETELSEGQLTQFLTLVSRRAAHEPLQYLTGHQEFFGLDLQITPDVLIPRPETELLVEEVFGWARGEATGPPSQQLVDVGTGSGAIALALAAHLPHAGITAVDLSPAALAVARANAVRLGLAERVRFLESDLLESLQPAIQSGLRLDAVVSNPPYVASLDAATLQPEVRDFEPHTALFAGEDGLAVYKQLIPEAFEALRRGGLLAMEFGFGQREALARLLKDWQAVRFFNDLAGIPRVVLAKRP